MKSRWIIVLSIVIITFQLALFNSNFSNKINWMLYDYLSEYSSKNIDQKTHQTVIVEIDEKSLKMIGQWPWPRVMTAQLLKKISRYNPQSITLDVLFVEKDRTSLKQIKDFYANFFNVNIGINGLPDLFLDNDAILADAIAVSNTILPVYLTHQKNSTNGCNVFSTIVDNDEKFNNLKSYNSALCSLPELHKSAKYSGFMNSYLDADGRYRRMPLIVKYKNSIIPSLAMTPLMKLFPNIDIKSANPFFGDYVITALNKKVLLGKKTNVLLDFYRRQWYKHVSAFDLLSDNFDPKLLIGKHIFVGTTAEGIQNLYNVAENKKLPGIHTLATFIENFFNNDLRVEPSIYKIIMSVLSIVLSLGMMIMLLYSRFLQAIIIFLAASVFSIVTAFILLNNGIYISLGYFLFPFISTFIILMFLYTIINFIEQKNFYKKLSVTL